MMKCDICNDLQDENIKLKAKLDSIKYLSREEVEKIIWEEIDFNDMDGFVGKADAVDKICSLAIKPIDKDRIIKILNNHVKFYVAHADMPLILGTDICVEQIANEIIGDKNE